jgi:hypothetical protein
MIGGSRWCVGNTIFALITAAIRTMCPQITKSIALGLD